MCRLLGRGIMHKKRRFFQLVRIYSSIINRRLWAAESQIGAGGVHLQLKATLFLKPSKPPIPMASRCGQAGDLGQVGLHQPPQVTHVGKIKKKSNFLVIYTVYCRFGISTLSFQVQPVPHKATKAKKAFNLTFRAWCHNLFSTVITLVDWEAAKGIKSPFSALPPLGHRWLSL